jgi:hypothetical protein
LAAYLGYSAFNSLAQGYFIGPYLGEFAFAFSADDDGCFGGHSLFSFPCDALFG